MKFNGKNIYISEKAEIGNNVKIGDNTSIYDNVVIGDNTIISNNCIIGEPSNSYYFDADYENPKTIIGKSSLIRSHTIIYCDNKIGDNFITGHRVTIREKSEIGNNCSLGTLTDIQGYVKIGNYCRFHSNVHIGQNSIIGNFVFIYPYAVLTNDPHPPSNICKGSNLEDYVQIAVHSIIMPGAKIGKHSLVGANSSVSGEIEEYSLLVGNPAKRICDVRDLKSKEENVDFHYPWPYNFERGMPWEGIGYDKWLNENSY